MPKLFLPVLLLLFTTGLPAQLDTLGQWTSLQSRSRGTYVTQSPEEVIYTTGNQIVFIDKIDYSISTLSRTDGLAGGRIELVKYHAPTETLIIVYENSTIDLYRNGRFSTLRQIDNFNFSGDKRIYDISFGADNLIYIAAGYGLSALSLDEEVFRFTTFTGVRVNSVLSYDGKLYAGTPEGLYRAPLQGVNLNDFNNWELLSLAQGLPGDYATTTVTVWQDRLYFGVDRNVYRLEGDSAMIHYSAPAAENELRYLNGGNGILLAGYRCTTSNCRDRLVLALEETPGVSLSLPDCAFLTNNAIQDQYDKVWLGDEAEGIRVLLDLTGECRRLNYPGPPEDQIYRLEHDGSALWVAPGQLNENTSPVFDLKGFWKYEDGEWTTYDLNNTPALLGRDGQRGGDDDVATIIDIDHDPVNGVTYFSSFYEGVVALDAEGEFTLFDETNSSLQLAPEAGPSRIRTAGSATDEQGYTYFAVSLAEAGGIVAVRGPDGQWAALGQQCGLNIAFDIAVDQNGFVWVLHFAGQSGGLTVIDPNGTPLDPSDDRCRTIQATSSNALPTNLMRSIAVDLDGNVWVGTAQGIVLFDCTPEGIFSDCPGRRPAATADDGFGGYLLETEEVRTIAVDGANRKWVGTNSGAYLLSETGEEQLLRFDRGNSPLLDDVVKSIAIDPVSGTVYFGTELGIISYRGDATSAASRIQFDAELEVFPNPVEPGYQGPVAVRGLAQNARVRITDVSGKLVYEGSAAGGQFVWDGADYNGRRVTSGVYLVFAVSRGNLNVENPGSAVAKIVFLR